jgi:hypothetical protein
VKVNPFQDVAPLKETSPAPTLQESVELPPRPSTNGQGPAVPTEGPPLARVRHAFTSYLYLPDPTVVDVVLATYIANHMRGDPVWLLVIGAPSRGKTEVVSALGGMEDVHMLSKLTGQTFASGMRKDRGASLLFRLEDQGKRVLVLKET